MARQPLRFQVTDLWTTLPFESLNSFAEAQALDLETEFVGSVVAIENLKAERIDAALVALPNIDEIDLSAYAVKPVAYTAARVLVHRENPIQEISYQDLQSIFDGSVLKRVKYWEDLDENAASLGVIRPYVVTTKVSIVNDLFRNRVFPDGYFSKDIPVISQEEFEEKSTLTV